jgi:uncharacterized protein YoxC
METDLTTTNTILGWMLAVQFVLMLAMIYLLVQLSRALGKLTEAADKIGSGASRLLDVNVEPILEEVRQRARESETIVQNLGQLSESVNRLGQALAEKDEDIKAIIGSCRQVTDGVNEATRGVRETVVPAVDQVSRLVRAFRRGFEVFGNVNEKKGARNDRR